MIRNIRHTGIVTRNLEAALAFYRDLLGFRETRRMEDNDPFIAEILGLEGVHVTTVKMSAPEGGQIEILFYRTHPGETRLRNINDYGLTHIAVTVQDLEAAYQALSGKGIRFISPPRTNPEKTAKAAFCRDPEGNLLELVEILER